MRGHSNAPGSPAPDWKGRASTHRQNLFAFLVRRGSTGVLASELYSQPDLYGRSPRNRASELARQGCRFLDALRTNGKQLGHWEGDNDYRYILVPPYPEKFDPLPNYAARTNAEGENLSLFSEVRP